MEAFFGASPINSSQPIEQTVYDFILWTENYFNTYIMAGAPSFVTNLFRTLLTLPLLWFQPNGISANATTVLASTLVTGLPANMTVIGNLCKRQNSYFSSSMGCICLRRRSLCFPLRADWNPFRNDGDSDTKQESFCVIGLFCLCFGRGNRRYLAESTFAAFIGHQVE